MKRGPFYTKSGASVVEVVLSGAVLALLVTALVGGMVYGQQSGALAGERARAVLLAQEGLEAVRSMRDGSFSGVGDGAHGLSISGGRWIFSGTQDTIGEFTRQTVVTSVDARRKDVSATVTWQQSLQRSGTVSLATRLTNWLAAAVGNWAMPRREASLNLAGTQDGIKIQTQGEYAYVVRNGGTPDFAVIDVSNPASPVLVASLSLAGTPQNIAVSGDYAYIASNSDTQELQIINISNPSAPIVAGTFNDAGTENGWGIAVEGNFAYLVLDGGNEFVAVDVSNPASPVLRGALDLGATAREVVVLGSYAYIASYSDSRELEVVDVTNPSAPSLIGSLNLSGTSNALTIAGFENTVVVGRSGGNVYVINVSNPRSPFLEGTLAAAAAINDLSLGNGNAYVFAGGDNNNAELRVIDITNHSTPALAGSLNIPAGSNPSVDLNGVAYHPGKDRVFAASDADNAEFMTLAPQ